MRTYYIQVGSQEYGPYTPEQMRDGISDGSITPDTPAKTSISGPWEEVGSIFPNIPVAQESSKARIGTSYGGTRFLINFTALLTIVLIGVGVAQMVKEIMATGEEPHLELSHYISAGIFLVKFLGILALRGLASALLDIAEAQQR
jgi:hypothetical protein